MRIYQNKGKYLKFRSRRWGSSLPGLRKLDPPLSPPSTPSKLKKIAPLGARGGGPNNFFLPEFLFILFRNPCKNLNSHDNPLWDFNNGGMKNNKITTTRKD